MISRPLGRRSTDKRTLQLNPLSTFPREVGENTMTTTWRKSLMARQHHMPVSLAHAACRCDGSRDAFWRHGHAPDFFLYAPKHAIRSAEHGAFVYELRTVYFVFSSANIQEASHWIQCDASSRFAEEKTVYCTKFVHECAVFSTSDGVFGSVKKEICGTAVPPKCVTGPTMTSSGITTGGGWSVAALLV